MFEIPGMIAAFGAVKKVWSWLRKPEQRLTVSQTGSGPVVINDSTQVTINVFNFSSGERIEDIPSIIARVVAAGEIRSENTERGELPPPTT